MKQNKRTRRSTPSRRGMSHNLSTRDIWAHFNKWFSGIERRIYERLSTEEIKNRYRRAPMPYIDIRSAADIIES